MLAGKSNRVAFGSRDRHPALIHAVRMARAEQRIYVLYYDYEIEEWCTIPYTEFKFQQTPLALEDIRYILLGGETTKLAIG